VSTIRKNIGSGIFYTAISKYSSVVISIIISAVLARLLTPAEFGVVAIVMVFISFFNLLSNFGLGPAIVQNKSLSQEDIESIFSFSIGLGFLLSIIFFAAAPLIASFYNDNTLIILSRLMSIAILFHSLQVVPNALNIKKLRFKQIGIISVLVHFTSGSVAILLAYLGFSYYALVINSILSGILLFVAYYLMAPVKIIFRIRLGAIRKIAKFSVFQFLFSFINYFSRNADNLLIGKFFSASALGYYDKSYRLMMMPVQNLTHVITPVLHPVLSNYQDDKKIIYNAYLKVVKLLATIGFPLSIFLFFSASEIINIMFGSQWDQSIPIFKLLALTVGIQMVLSSTGSIFQATNRTDLMFYAGFIGAVLMLSGISLGVFVGKSLVAIGYCLIVAFILNLLTGFFLLINTALNTSFIKFLGIFIFPLLITFGVGLTLFFVSSIELDNLLLSISLKIIVSIFSFGIIFSFSKENREMYNEYLGKKLRKRL